MNTRFNTKGITKEMVEYVRGLSEGVKPENLHQGLCFNFNHKFNDDRLYYIPEEVCVEWEHFSGSATYPVGGSCYNKWNDHERLDWCRHVADYLEQLKEQPI